MSEQPPPRPSEPASGPAIGRDEWVARHDERRSGRSGTFALVESRLQRVPWWAWLTLFIAGFSLVPAIADSGNNRVAFDTVIYMLLALGLNVVVGWGGLLDLGYVAFYGVGAYAYALLDSDKHGIHLPTIVSIPVVVAIGAATGFLVGLPSRRLVGDYLAIVTLFFLQIFFIVTNNGDNIFGGHDLTGGANGILNVDPLSFFGNSLPVQHGGEFAISYLYVALALFALVYVGLRFVNESRTGRAWRSLREDPLAAETMGMPVNLLKLMAFSFGAAVAAFTGTLFSALNANTFPLTFSFPLLITVYTMVILGGQGNQAGVTMGAIVVSVLLDELQDPGHARFVFYLLALLGLIFAFRRSWRLGAVLGGTLAFGFAAHAIADAVDHSWVTGVGTSTTGGYDLAHHWVIVPTTLATWLPPVSYIGLIGVALLLTVLRGWLRLVLLVPTLYLAAFVWENVMIRTSDAIAPMRYIVLGLILIALMIVRPNGLRGERRVEII